MNNNFGFSKEPLSETEFRGAPQYDWKGTLLIAIKGAGAQALLNFSNFL